MTMMLIMNGMDAKPIDLSVDLMRWPCPVKLDYILTLMSQILEYLMDVLALKNLTKITST